MNVHFGIIPETTALRITGAVSSPSALSEKLDSFANLEDGWDFGFGSPIPKHRIRAAKVWAAILELFGFINLDASPGGEGEISVSGRLGNHHVEAIIESDDVSASLAHEFNEIQQFYKLRMPTIEALATLLEVMGEIWNASTLFTQGNLISPSAGGLGLPFGITAAHSLYFQHSVFSSQGVGFANTPIGITGDSQTFAVTPQFGGHSIPTIYRRAIR